MAQYLVELTYIRGDGEPDEAAIGVEAVTAADAEAQAIYSITQFFEAKGKVISSVTAKTVER